MSDRGNAITHPQSHPIPKLYILDVMGLRVGNGISVASFPGLSHLQYLMTYSMQIRRGKAWEIWSCTVTSGRQRVQY